MHAPVMQGAPWVPPTRSPDNRVLILAVILFVFLGVFSVVALVGTPLFGSEFAGLLVPVCGALLVLGFLAIGGAMGAFRRAPLPPPPPIQQPMVPAGRQPPIAINCPNCGAPPGLVDRFGVAVCTHCGARFIVR
jgi:hypothetical protein